MNSLAALPSPTTSVWTVGPFPLRAYALCIILGMVVACVVTDRRMRARGTAPYVVLDLAIWAIPFGIVGARVYSLITSPQDYFGAGHGAWEWLQIWHGGLGIWGAVMGGALGAWIGARQRGLALTFVADALAVGLPLAQALGRFGNWFNNELYGRPTSLPWGLEVHQMDGGKAVLGPDGQPLPVDALHPDWRYHPTFLYEALWCVGIAVLVWLLDRRYKFGRGRAFALYVMAYTVGRFWIESLRTDPANHLLGMRVNSWVSILVFLGALAYFLRFRGAPQQRAVPVPVVSAEGVADPAKAGAGKYRMVDAPEGAELATARARADGSDALAADPTDEAGSATADDAGDDDAEDAEDDEAAGDPTNDDDPAADEASADSADVDSPAAGEAADEEVQWRPADAEPGRK